MKLLLTLLHGMAPFVLAILAWTTVAGANGIEWSVGYSGTQPGPVKQSELYLDEEHVVMTPDKVKADFWVMNPSERDIKIQMGFPIKGLFAGGRQDPYGEKNALKELPGCLEKKEVRVLVDGKPVPVTVTCPKNGDYSTVIKWSMTYPAGAKTHFSVSHPHSGSMTGGGEGTHVSSKTYWSYIVHTGAYWSRPIGKARLEFCGPPVATYCKDPKGTQTWDADGLWQYDKALNSIKPQQTSTDCAKSCLVWERTDWVPAKSDDIEVGYAYSSAGVGDGNLDSSDLGIDRYCATSRDVKDNPKIWHFAESTPIATAPLDSDNLEVIFDVAAGQKFGLVGNSSVLEDLPEHIMTRFRLSLYRYLRNWLAASHGHEFKDPKLRACYETVPKRTTPLTAIELKNMEFLKKQEKIWEEKDRAAWEKIRNNLEPEEHGSGMSP